jgi:hypothetical protein
MSTNDAAKAFDPNSIELGDWRIAKTGWVTAIGADQLAIPLPFHQVTAMEEAGKSHSFVTPSAPALHLNFAWKLARQAAASKAHVRWNTGQTLPFNVRYDIAAGSVGALYDYFEETMACAIASFAAVEAFCNGVLAENAKFPISTQRKRSGVVETVSMNLEEAERLLTTDEKLKRFVPDLLNVPTPSGKKPWQAYKRLKDLRDTVTHFKRRDQAKHADNSHEPTALLAMTQIDPRELPEGAMLVIEYFYKKEALPRWMRNPDWKRQG